MRWQPITIEHASEKLEQELRNLAYTASINHKLNKACRGHYKELMKIGFAEKGFS